MCLESSADCGHCVSQGSALHVARRLAPLLGLDEALEERLLLVGGQAGALTGEDDREGLVIFRCPWRLNVQR
jgi:hypothetical protein